MITVERPIIKMSGKTAPPADMVEAAKKSLGNRYGEFIKKYPGEITSEKLVKFMEQ